MPHPSQKIVLTDEQLESIKRMAGFRMPHWQMAALLKISPSVFGDLIQRDLKVQEALMEGRAAMSENMRRTLTQRAMGERDPQNPSKYIYEPDAAALKLWVMSQEGFKVDNSVEVNINHTAELPAEEKRKEIDRLLELRALECAQDVVNNSEDDADNTDEKSD